MASTYVEEIVKHGKTFQESKDEVARRGTIVAAHKLLNELETPFEKLARIGWGEGSRNAVLRTAFELGLLAKLSDTPMSSAQLAEGTGADPQLIARTFKHLAANGIVKETGKDQYCATSFTMAAQDPTFEAGLIFSFEGMMPVMERLPEFLAKTNYQVPTDENNGPLQYGLNNPKHFWGIAEENPRLGGAFNKFMTGYSLSRPRWVNFYPCEERLLQTSTQAPTLVDVGGGLGHDVAAFHKKFPNWPGALIVQDTRSVVAQAKASSELPPAVKHIEHDFFTAQPEECRGAQVYFLRQILHDWPEKQSELILSNLRDAMTPHHSKILINELVVYDTGATWEQTSLDVLMMGLLVSRERTESQWHELLAKVGLKISGIWRTDDASPAIIEAVLADD